MGGSRDEVSRAMLFLGGEHSVWQVRSFTWEAQVSSGIIVKCKP